MFVVCGACAAVAGYLLFRQYQDRQSAPVVAMTTAKPATVVAPAVPSTQSTASQAATFGAGLAATIASGIGLFGDLF